MRYPRRLVITTLTVNLLSPLAFPAAPPALKLIRQDQLIEVSWPGSEKGFRLETLNPRLASPDWRPIEQAAVRFNGSYRLTLPIDPAAEAGFFRLQGLEHFPLGDIPGDYIDSDGDGIDGEFSRSIFLAPAPFGDDRNPGTPDRPVASLKQAVELAESIPLKSWVCMAQGTYKLSAPLRMPPRVSLFGQYDGTTNWVQSAGNITRIQGPSTVLIFGEYPQDTFRLPIHMFGLEVIASDASQPGESSYGIRINGRSTVDTYPGLIIDRCVVQAGRGADGANGTPGVGGAPGSRGANGFGGAIGGIGGIATGTAGGGGAGGLGNSGTAGSPDAGGLIAGGHGGGSRTGCRRGEDGYPGNDGIPGLNGQNAPGSDVFWGTLGPSGYSHLDGAAGLPGTAGTGGSGGGGGGSNSNGPIVGCAPAQAGGGGAGGAGGAAGSPGGAGRGGGSSISVYSFASHVVILDSELIALDGGNGGRGGDGGKGGAGGIGGSGGPSNGYGAAGGHGGTGASGGTSGSGSGGPGGHTAALLFERIPNLDDFGSGNRYIIGRPGLGGEGGSTSALGSAPSGATGLALIIGTRPPQ